MGGFRGVCKEGRAAEGAGPGLPSVRAHTPARIPPLSIPPVPCFRFDSISCTILPISATSASAGRVFPSPIILTAAGLCATRVGFLFLSTLNLMIPYRIGTFPHSCFQVTVAPHGIANPTTGHATSFDDGALNQSNKQLNYQTNSSFPLLHRCHYILHFILSYFFCFLFLFRVCFFSIFRLCV